MVFFFVSSTPCFSITAWHFDMIMSYFSFPSTALPSFMSLSVYLPLSNYIYMILILGGWGKGRQPKVVSMTDMSSACFLSQKLKSIYTFSRLFCCLTHPSFHLPFFSQPPQLHLRVSSASFVPKCPLKTFLSLRPFCKSPEFIQQGLVLGIDFSLDTQVYYTGKNLHISLTNPSAEKATFISKIYMCILLLLYALIWPIFFQVLCFG